MRVLEKRVMYLQLLQNNYDLVENYSVNNILEQIVNEIFERNENIGAGT